MGKSLQPQFDKNVSPNWKPVGTPEQSRKGMDWTDILWHVVVCLGGLGVTGLGVFWAAYFPFKRLAVIPIVAGLAIFYLGFPDSEQRKGYRSV